MKKMVIYIFGFLCSLNLKAQENHNAISIELGKTLLLGNVVFDHLLCNEKIGFRAVLGFNILKYRNAFFIGGGAYYLAGTNKNYLELGTDIGFLKVGEKKTDESPNLIYPDFDTKSILLSTNLGYRRYSNSKLFRIGISPFLIKQGLSMGGYFSLGFQF